MFKLYVLHTICHNSDMFRSILIIFRELLSTACWYVYIHTFTYTYINVPNCSYIHVSKTLLKQRERSDWLLSFCTQILNAGFESRKVLVYFFHE
jgi:hypothetical protein